VERGEGMELMEQKVPKGLCTAHTAICMLDEWFMVLEEA
jgi:hypothetical protein